MVTIVPIPGGGYICVVYPCMVTIFPVFQVVGIFAGFGVLLLVASPFLLLAAPCILCCKCTVCKCCEYEDDLQPPLWHSKRRRHKFCNPRRCQLMLKERIHICGVWYFTVHLCDIIIGLNKSYTEMPYFNVIYIHVFEWTVVYICSMFRLTMLYHFKSIHVSVGEFKRSFPKLNWLYWFQNSILFGDVVISDNVFISKNTFCEI